MTFLCGLAAAVVLVVAVIQRTPFDKLWVLRYLMPVLGLLSSLGVVLLAKVVQLAFTDPQKTTHPPPYLIFPVYIVPPLERVFDKLYCWRSGRMDSLKGFVNRISQWPLEVLRCAGQGYLIEPAAPVGQLALQSGHVFAMAASLFATATYLSIGYAKSSIDASSAYVPALAFVLLTFTVACWSLGALTFFFDRYRFPLLACIALLSLGTTFAPVSDHLYRVMKVSADPRNNMMRPADLVRDRYNRNHKRLVLVATAGGGIQAGAWTATVLHRLQQECANSASPDQCDLLNSIVLISSVSGGTEGAMAYAAAVAANPDQPDTAQVVHNTRASAIDEVAWAWTNPDFFRAIAPWFRTEFIDRGWALEEKWSWINHLHRIEGVERNDCFLSRWFRRYQVNRTDTFRSQWAPQPGNNMPALLFNATVVESGRPLVFSTTNFPARDVGRGPVNFYDLFRGSNESPKQSYDIRVNTAARLSASFPYVAPAARSDFSGSYVPDYHLVDGGYYDNFGIASLLGWLEDAICPDGAANCLPPHPIAGPGNKGPQPDGNPLADVLIIEIRPFPPPAQRPGSVHGWGYQITAPVDALLGVRDSGQLAHDDSELALFTRNYKQRGINVWRADFVFPATAAGVEDVGCAPLSWKLSVGQMKCIDKGWNDLKDGVPGKSAPSPDIGCVLNYLRDRKVVQYGSADQPSDAAYCRSGDAPTPEVKP